MRDMPVFDTQYGVASLVLKEIPYREIAYVIIRDSLEPEKLIEECVGFCRACGAERVYATGHGILESRPFYTAVWEMRCVAESLPETDAALWPVQEKTAEEWRSIYNNKVRNVPNGAWMESLDARAMLKKGDGYFIHRGGELLGIGRAGGGAIDWVAAVKPGAGRDVVAALGHLLTEDTVTLTVASTNEKAVRLYESLGFVKTKEITRWYRVW